MKDIITAERLLSVHSDIRGDLYDEALKMMSGGEDVLRLNTGNPGTFGFGMPNSIKQAVLDNLDRSVPYCDFRGVPTAREAICSYQLSRGFRGIHPDDIYITNGVSEGVLTLCLALLNKGDEVLMPSPCYSLWSNSTRIADAIPVFYKCDEQNAWNPDIEDIAAKITPKTRALVIINPNNPTGAVYSAETVKQMLSLAEQHNLIVFSDEIYDRLVYSEASFTSTAALAGEDITVITTNGLSKSHSVCGLRCGWFVISANKAIKKKIKDALNKLLSMRLCANSLMQFAIPAALEDELSTQQMICPGGRLYEQTAATMRAIDQIEGLTCVTPHAAFYCFPRISPDHYNVTNAHDFCLGLLHHQKILIIPGSSFEYDDQYHFRIVMLPKPDRLTDAVEKIGIELRRYKK